MSGVLSPAAVTECRACCSVSGLSNCIRETIRALRVSVFTVGPRGVNFVDVTASDDQSIKQVWSLLHRRVMNFESAPWPITAIQLV